MIAWIALGFAFLAFLLAVLALLRSARLELDVSALIDATSVPRSALSEVLEKLDAERVT